MPPVAEPVNGSSNEAGGPVKCRAKTSPCGVAPPRQNRCALKNSLPALLTETVVGGRIENGAAQGVVVADGGHELRGAGADGLHGDAGHEVGGCEPEDGRDRLHRIAGAELGLALVHGNLRHPAAAVRGVDDVHADGAVAEFERDGGTVAGGIEFQQAVVNQREARGDGGMTGQRDFFAGGEITRPEVGARTRRGPQDEAGFGKILLAGDGLHRRGIEVIRVEDDGTGVAGERVRGEGIHLHEGIGLGHSES